MSRRPVWTRKSARKRQWWLERNAKPREPRTGPVIHSDAKTTIGWRAAPEGTALAQCGFYVRPERLASDVSEVTCLRCLRRLRPDPE